MLIHTIEVGDIATNCYIVADDDAKVCAVIDPGDQPERLLAFLEQENLKAEYIFLTHGHFDHIMGAGRLRSQTGAKLVIHESDAHCLTDRRRSYALKAPNTGSPDITASDGLVITVGALEFKWLNTPGHSEGSSVILCKDAMFSGDTLFFDECGRCDLYGGDYKKMLASLRRLSGLDGDYTVYPGHGRSSTLSRERVSNPYMKEACARDSLS